MGKAARLKREQKEQGAPAPEPKILNTIHLNMLSNGQVTVSGPITEPALVIDVFGKALNSLSMYYLQEKQKEQRILQPGKPPLILPQ